MGTPLVKAKQDRSIRVEDLTEVVAGAVSGRPSSDWYHLNLPGTSSTPMIVHVRRMGVPPAFSGAGLASDQVSSC
jgi:hypothetical protein